MRLVFDKNGFLFPYTFIELDLSAFESVFVDDFANSTTRRAIFLDYLRYLDILQSIFGKKGFYQWINGSFVTRKLNPNDIDIVTFVNSEILRANYAQLQSLSKDDLLRSLKVDGYFTEVLPSDHKSYFVYQSDRVYWLNQFSYTKRNAKTNKRHEKGFIQLTF